MRRLLGWLAFWLCIPAFAAAAPPIPVVVITAQQIALHSDRAVLIADGGVSVRTPSLQISATRAAYDLRANRLIAAGAVSVRDAGSTRSGTGFVYDFASEKGDFTRDAIVPQLPASEAIATGQQAELRPAQSIAFTNAQVRSGATFTPMPAYTYEIPSPHAKDFGYSPVPSAALEWPFLLSENSNSYSFARARYDRYNGGLGTGLEEHYARTDRGYVSIGETLDVDTARFDLAAYERFNDSLSQSLTGSDLLGAHAFRYALTSSGREGFASLSFAQYNAERSDDLLFTGNQRPLARAGTMNLQIDFGHDVHPSDYRGAEDWRVTPSVAINSASLRMGSASLSNSVSLGESFYNYGRATLATSDTLWGTFPLSQRLLFSGGATFSHEAPPFPSTDRTYTLGSTWKASRVFNLVSSITYAHDYQQAFNFGRPEFIAAFDVRVIRRNGTGVEVGTLIPFGAVGNMYRQSGFNLRFFKAP
jgi:hypothetical protein